MMFTVEETNFMSYFDTSSRGALIHDMKTTPLNDLDDEMQRTLIVGDEPFLVYLTELVLRTDPDPFKHLLHFLLGRREFHPFTHQRPFVVLAKVGNIGFKASILSLIHI